MKKQSKRSNISASDLSAASGSLCHTCKMWRPEHLSNENDGFCGKHGFITHATEQCPEHVANNSAQQGAHIMKDYILVHGRNIPVEQDVIYSAESVVELFNDGFQLVSDEQFIEYKPNNQQ